MLIIVGGGIVGTHVVLFIRKLMTTLDSIGDLVNDTRRVIVHLNPDILLLISQCNDVSSRLNQLINQTSPTVMLTTKEASILVRKLQGVADSLVFICEAVVLVPIRKKVKELVCLPFTSCRRPPDEHESS